MNKNLTIMAITLAASVIAACSDNNSTQPDSALVPDQPSVSQALSPGAVKQAAQEARQASLPKPDTSTPDSTYVKLTSGNQLMFLYTANSGLPPDYETLAGHVSSEYRRTSDSFRKHDLMAALKPKINAQIADAKAHPYVLWVEDSPGIRHYDFERKGFPVQTALFSARGSAYMYDNSNYKFAFANGSQFEFLPVSDQAVARQIEAMVGHSRRTKIKIFAFVQSTDDSNGPVVKAQIVKVQLLDSKGRTLLEQEAK